MRTSLIETEQIEAHLLQLSGGGDALVFEAKMLIDAELTEKVLWQQKTYQMVKLYGRDQLRQEIESAHQKLFKDEQHQSFRQKIMRLFIKK
ncbi:hypothetical protein [Mucilaginibacter ginsenosidivorans]|uniref:Uncharacterized protein n=1 Tax=Mucilaginibacter ginsenosidivorans TaxID=398053 RepID=A0A5B8UWA5_9SPHI|nr:hypothetical protein [Mucilaginibacter ginsenosidivorans]QEC63188.1 hypothetical protein FRZ54_11565 [Mucilaginibacter ginsenosidivorans]